MASLKPQTFRDRVIGTPIGEAFDAAQEIVNIGQTDISVANVDRLKAALERMSAATAALIADKAQK